MHASVMACTQVWWHARVCCAMTYSVPRSTMVPRVVCEVSRSITSFYRACLGYLNFIHTCKWGGSLFPYGSDLIKILYHCFYCSEALPFFLLLIDLSKASALAKIAFKSRNKVSGLMVCLPIIMVFIASMWYSGTGV